MSIIPQSDALLTRKQVFFAPFPNSLEKANEKIIIFFVQPQVNLKNKSLRKIMQEREREVIKNLSIFT